MPTQYVVFPFSHMDRSDILGKVALTTVQIETRIHFACIVQLLFLKFHSHPSDYPY